MPSLGALTLNHPWIHPLTVHFPIALWLTGSLLYLLSLNRRMRWLLIPAMVCGLLGTGTGWLALQTGQSAYRAVAPRLASFYLIDRHREQAEVAFTFFSVCWMVLIVFHLIREKAFPAHDTPRILKLAFSVGFLLGSTYLILSGVKGFRLVYEQSVAVRPPTGNLIPLPMDTPEPNRATAR